MNEQRIFYADMSLSIIDSPHNEQIYMIPGESFTVNLDTPSGEDNFFFEIKTNV